MNILKSCFWWKYIRISIGYIPKSGILSFLDSLLGPQQQPETRFALIYPSLYSPCYRAHLQEA